MALGAKIVAADAKEDWITTKVKTKIGLTKLFGVHVTTAEGTVSLSGVVKTAGEKDEIGRLARETDGVATVINNIVVGGLRGTTGAP